MFRNREDAAMQLAERLKAFNQTIFDKIMELCDEAVILSVPEILHRVADHYQEELPTIDDDCLCDLLCHAMASRKNRKAAVSKRVLAGSV